MSRFRERYGAAPLHLLALIAASPSPAMRC